MAVSGEKLSKSFSGVRVLDDVSIDVADGKIHALLGANGSGKSTLIKILTGVYQNEAGEVIVAGERLRTVASPALARSLGIAVVHQEAPLIDTSTVAECVALFRGYPSRAGLLQWGALHDQVEAMLARFSFSIDPRRLAGTLTPAERAMVSLAIALDGIGSSVSMLVLDEVTASLLRDEAEPYLEKVTELARSGIGVLMVTHRLAEVRDRADSATILRDGKVVFAGSPQSLDDEAIVDLIVGASERASGVAGAPAAASARARDGDALLRLRNLAGTFIRDVSLDLYPGEIVGIAGLAETGTAELPNILSGEMARKGGEVSVRGQAIAARSGPRGFIKAGVVVLPADRLRAGGIGTLPVGENILLPNLGRFWGRLSAERSHVDVLLETFDVRPRVAGATFGKLSGGNQQKALLAKWLDQRPSVLVLDDPTSGVDPGARERIFATLRSVAAEGIGILFFSTEPEQLAVMCSRVLVLKEGTVAKELSGAELSHQSISRWCYS